MTSDTTTNAPAVLRRPPAGFSPEQWRAFERDGFLAIPDALTPDEVSMYRATAEEWIRRRPDYAPGHTWKIHDLVRLNSVFADLIDHDRHLGYAYDLYGDQVRLTQADLFVRPRNGTMNQWHVDGPRALPYRSFSPVLPLKLRIGYWLTDVPDPEMGNLVYLPGSHHGDYQGDHSGTGVLPGQRILLCTAGTMTIAHASVWHRVESNRSHRTRVNLFLSYTPSWIAGYYHYDRQFLDTLGREQRIILRAYDDPEDLTRPPESDLPLFDDPDSVRSAPAETDVHKLRRWTRYERHLKTLVTDR